MDAFANVRTCTTRVGTIVATGAFGNRCGEGRREDKQEVKLKGSRD
jgi:hypothetical protein